MCPVASSGIGVGQGLLPEMASGFIALRSASLLVATNHPPGPGVKLNAHPPHAGILERYDPFLLSLGVVCTRADDDRLRMEHGRNAYDVDRCNRPVPMER